MTDTSRFAVYLSHSWRPRDVDLNLQVWEQLASQCELLVDRPEQAGANPPYYINRIEELFRRTDFFVSILTYRDSDKPPSEPGDAQLRCSHYSLFEVRLAERADIPRLILYERTTGFRPPRRSRPGEMYVPFDRGTTERLPEQRQWDTVVRPKIEDWIDWARRNRAPVSYEQSMCAVTLASPDTSRQLGEVIDDCLARRGYEPIRIDRNRQTSREAFRQLREVGLVVADFAADAAIGPELYSATHALGLPTIRLRGKTLAEEPLPWILRGDPGGYANDIVQWTTPEDLPAEIEPRMAAMFRLSEALRDGRGSEYLQSKRYSQFLVFLSHTLKPPHRQIVEDVFRLLEKRHVKPFEYHQVNTAGIDWRTALDKALKDTTHFVVLLSPEYEQSETCMLEMDAVLARGEAVTMLPFMLGGRTRPNPKLVGKHNVLLPEDPREAAQMIVDQTMASLDAAQRTAETSPR